MSSRKLAAFGTAVVALTIGVAPILTNAADHLDAPAIPLACLQGNVLRVGLLKAALPDP